MKTVTVQLTENEATQVLKAANMPTKITVKILNALRGTTTQPTVTTTRRRRKAVSEATVAQ